ncbi:tetratricopeptide repeat protein [Streptomyces sp. NPDC058548]|uniref:tetratricopeptide repeat protein n=1 Tax=Streptomyces sp. NPDC058548 TaxID=3346545 RepID=UPI00365EFB06
MSSFQSVRVESGYGYGVVGADLHVFQDQGPLYLLSEHQAPELPRREWLLAQPSRLLAARWGLVEFTGRERELAELVRWRDDSGGGLSCRWMHGPGGQGKTRLSDELALRSAAAGWKCVTAVHGPGTLLPPATSQDLRTAGTRGLLLIVDYADRWPLSHLAWLLSNRLLHTDVPTRVLFLARSNHVWSAVRSLVADVAGEGEALSLPPLGGSGLTERERMFAAARDCFAGYYGVADPTVIPPPAQLAADSFGLVLALQMAALTAVDAHVREVPAPQEPAAFSAYLLDREQKHWTRLYEAASHGVDFRTAPSEMRRAVFAAALSGARPYGDAVALLERVGFGQAAERLAADHALCYPPEDPRTALEPLTPDRLAEDFIALTLPGHGTADHPPAAWAEETVDRILARAPDGSPPTELPRVMAFLVAAAGEGRWPHVPGLLNTLLQREPVLAVEAGAGTLIALARIPGIDPGVLRDIDLAIPQQGHRDLDAAAAELSARWVAALDPNVDDPVRDGDVAEHLNIRMERAGRFEEAVQAASAAVKAWLRLADADPQRYGPRLAWGVSLASGALMAAGRPVESLQAAQDAQRIIEQLDTAGVDVDDTTRVAVVTQLAAALMGVGRMTEALEPTDRAITLLEAGRHAEPHGGDVQLAGLLTNKVKILRDLERFEEAVGSARDAVALWRGLSRLDPHAYQDALALALTNESATLHALGRLEEALPPAVESVGTRTRLAEVNPLKGEPGLALALGNLAVLHSDLGRHREALDAARSAVESLRNLTARWPERHEPMLALTLSNLSSVLHENHYLQDALKASKEAVEIRRRWATRLPEVYEMPLADSLQHLANAHVALSQAAEAVAAAREMEAILRRTAAAHPGAGTLVLGRGLVGLGAVLSEAGHRDEALAITEEAVGLLSSQSGAAADAATATLVLALRNLSGLLRGSGRKDEARRAAGEALDLERRAAVAGVGGQAAAEAAAVMTVIEQDVDVERWQTALAALTEVLPVWRHLYAKEPRRYAPQLAYALHLTQVCLNRTDAEDAELAAATELMEVHRRAIPPTGERVSAVFSAARRRVEILQERGVTGEVADAWTDCVAEARKPSGEGPSADAHQLTMMLPLLFFALQKAERWPEAIAAAEDSTTVNAWLYERDAQPRYALGVAMGLWLAAMARAATGSEYDRALADVDEALAAMRLLEPQRAEEPPTGLLRQMETTRAEILEALGRSVEASAQRRRLGSGPEDQT